VITSTASSRIALVSRDYDDPTTWLPELFEDEANQPSCPNTVSRSRSFVYGVAVSFRASSASKVRYVGVWVMATPPPPPPLVSTRICLLGVCACRLRP